MRDYDKFNITHYTPLRTLPLPLIFNDPERSNQGRLVVIWRVLIFQGRPRSTILAPIKILYRWFAAQRYYVHKTCFPENHKDTKVVCRMYVMWTYHNFVLLTPARDIMTIIDKITCSDVNKTITSIELLAINILCYISYVPPLGLGIKLMAGSLLSQRGRAMLRVCQ